MHISYTDKDIKRILKDNGFVFHHQTGSHRIYKDDNGRHISIRCNKHNSMVMLRLIKENNLVVNL